jgi:hypothetical protein
MAVDYGPSGQHCDACLVFMRLWVSICLGGVGLVVLGEMGLLSEAFAAEGAAKGLFASVGADVDVH